MFATQVLPETLSNDELEEENTSEIVGCLIVGEKKYEVKRGETKIGRDSIMCSIVIDNFTVSKVHAVIESEGIDDTFVYDAGSTNQTKLGKKVLKPHCRYKLDNKSKLLLGNVTAEFVLPPDKSSDAIVNIKKAESVSFNQMDDLENIFDIATQVTAPETSIAKISVFKKAAENLKTPKLVFPAQVKESPESLMNVLNEATQCKLNSQETTSKKVFHLNNSVENTNIFNLSTQCQLYEAQTQEYNCDGIDNSDKNKNSEVKSLLSDDKNDVLCTFAPLHSPKPEKDVLSNKIRVRDEVEDLTEVFDAPTQIDPVSSEKNDIQNEASVEDFSKKSLCEPSITSTPLIKKNNKNEIVENFGKSKLDLSEEDFIKTQEFNIQNKNNGQDVLNADEETQPYLGETLHEEQKSNEDFILTQSFKMPEIQKDKRNTNVIPESEDFHDFREDLMETQIYDVAKELNRNGLRDEERIPPHQLPDSDDENLVLTQRDNEEDFIATQSFEVVTDLRKNCEKNDNDDEEDFIATQLLEISTNKTQNRKSSQEKKTNSSSRDSTPDLLDFPENSCKDSEDFISTQLFEVPECQTSGTKSPEQSNSLISSHFRKYYCNTSNSKKTGESSSDETESDLEIILDQTGTGKTGECIRKTFKTESESENNTQINDNNSNSSYTFEVGPENQIEEVSNKKNPTVAKLSDSDETDCEEIIVLNSIHSIKKEPLERVEFEDTQVLTLSLPDNYERVPDPNDDCMNGRESPKFEMAVENGPESPLRLKIPNAQEERNKQSEDEKKETEDYGIPSKIKRTEVGINKSDGKVDSPLKRPLDNKDTDVIPIKKSKTGETDKSLKSSEKQFLKLVQAHDITQIQPSRTRNSLKMITPENKKNKTDSSVTNVQPSSRRKTDQKKGNTKKVNGDIKSYLTIKKIETRRKSSRERKKEESPKENKVKEPKPVENSSRVLRSSKKNNSNGTSSILVEGPGKNIPLRRSRRISRTKSDEYFTNPSVNVAFTGFSCESLEEIISELGGKKTNDLSCAEVIVADKVRRTVKFLCAVGLGLPITSPEWLLTCRKKQKFINPWDFILKDEESEEIFNFELRTSLEKSKKVKLLQGFNVFATKNAKPPVKDLLAIVECCGGTPLFHPPDIWPKKTIIVSCLEDKQSWPMPKLRNVKIVHFEFILGGVLRQKIDFKTYNLS